MKKLLVLLVVLGLVSTASAGVIDIQATGGLHAVTAAPSDTINLEITFLAPATENLFNLGVKIIVSSGATLGDLPAATLVYNAAFDPSMKQILPGVINVPANISTGFGPVGTGSALVVVTGITLHVDATGAPILVTLADFDTPSIIVDGNGTELAHSYGNGVTITPEPMTMMLLGLGSLFLVRRKK